MTVIEQDGSRPNVEGEGIASRETDTLEAMPPGLQPVVAQQSLSRELPRTIPSMVHQTLAQGLEVLDDVYIDERLLTDDFSKKERGTKSFDGRR